MDLDRRLLSFARGMRHNPAPAEKLMWKLLRNRRLAGFRFRRQEPLAPYIADFYCAVAKVVIELDGDSHSESQIADRVRQETLESRGFLLLRFWNTELFESQDAVLDAIYRACHSRISGNPAVSHKLDEWGQFTSGEKQAHTPHKLLPANRIDYSSESIR